MITAKDHPISFFKIYENTGENLHCPDEKTKKQVTIMVVFLK